MTYVNPTDTIISSLTDAGREIIANSLLGTLSFQLQGFKVGRHGYDDTTPDPVKVVAINTALLDLVDPVFPVPTTDLKPFVTIETPYPNVIAPVCRVDRTECFFGLGEIGIFGEIMYNSGGPPFYTVGSTHMLAVAHFPLMGKTDKHVFVFRLILSL